MNQKLSDVMANSSKSFQKLNSGLLETKGYPCSQNSGNTPLKATSSVPRLRQDRTGLNKTEAAFLVWLKNFASGQTIYSQDFTLRLANGVRYTPDFVLIDAIYSKITCYEVKGPHAWDDAIVKIKVAASKYPAFGFVLVWRTSKTGGWQQQQIIP